MKRKNSIIKYHGKVCFHIGMNGISLHSPSYRFLLLSGYIHCSVNQHILHCDQNCAYKNIIGSPSSKYLKKLSGHRFPHVIINHLFGQVMQPTIPFIIFYCHFPYLFLLCGYRYLLHFNATNITDICCILLLQIFEHFKEKHLKIIFSRSDVKNENGSSSIIQHTLVNFNTQRQAFH